MIMLHFSLTHIIILTVWVSYYTTVATGNVHLAPYSGVAIDWTSDSWLLPLHLNTSEDPCDNVYVHKELCTRFIQQQVENIKRNATDQFGLFRFNVELSATAQVGDIQVRVPLQYPVPTNDDFYTRLCSEWDLDVKTCEAVTEQLRAHLSSLAVVEEQATLHRVKILQDTYPVVFTPQGFQTQLGIQILLLESNAKAVLSKGTDLQAAHQILEDIYYAAAQFPQVGHLLGYTRAIDLLLKAEYHATKSMSSALQQWNNRSSGTEQCPFTTEFLEVVQRIRRIGRMKFKLGDLDGATEMMKHSLNIIDACCSNATTILVSECSSTQIQLNKLEGMDTLLEIEVIQGNYHQAVKSYQQIIQVQCGTRFPGISCKIPMNVLPLVWQAITLPAVATSVSDLESKYHDMIVAGKILEASIPSIRYWLHQTSQGEQRNGLMNFMNEMVVEYVPNYLSLYAGAPQGVQVEIDHRKRVASIFSALFPEYVYHSPQLVPRKSKMALDAIPHVGFISSNLGHHSVGKLVCGVIEQLAMSQRFRITLILYGNIINQELHPDYCRNVRVMSLRDQSASEIPNVSVLEIPHIENPRDIQSIIAALQLDVLVFSEMALSLPMFLLGYSRIAPVQVSFWGQMVSSGHSSNIDYAIVPKDFVLDTEQMLEGNNEQDTTCIDDTCHETIGLNNKPTESGKNSISKCLENYEELTAEELVSECIPICNTTMLSPSYIPFSETMICTETLGTYFPRMESPTKEQMSIAREVISNSSQGISIAKEDQRHYLFPHTLGKFHPNWDTVILGILESDSNAIVLLPLGTTQSFTGFSIDTYSQSVLQSRLFHFIENNSLHPNPEQLQRRIAWFPIVPQQVYGALAMQVDVVVDINPVAAGVSALELLSLGVPIVSYPNGTIAGPRACALYSIMGLSSLKKHLCATNVPDMISLATEFANNATLSKRVREAVLLAATTQDDVYQDKRVTLEWSALMSALMYSSPWQWEDDKLGALQVRKTYQITRVAENRQHNETAQSYKKPIRYEEIVTHLPPSPNVWKISN